MRSDKHRDRDWRTLVVSMAGIGKNVGATATHLSRKHTDAVLESCARGLEDARDEVPGLLAVAVGDALVVRPCVGRALPGGGEDGVVDGERDEEDKGDEPDNEEEEGEDRGRGRDAVRVEELDLRAEEGEPRVVVGGEEGDGEERLGRDEGEEGVRPQEPQVRRVGDDACGTGEGGEFLVRVEEDVDDDGQVGDHLDEAAG